MCYKTMHLTNCYHACSGGIKTFYDELMNSAERQERPLCLVVPGPANHVEQYGRHVRIYQVAAPPAPGPDRRYRLISPRSYLSPRGELRRILRLEKPSLLEIADKYTLPYLSAMIRKGWLPGVPPMITIGLTAERLDDNIRAYKFIGAPGGWLARFIMREIYFRMFDYHIAVSKYTAEELQASRWTRKHPDKIKILPMGVALDPFACFPRDRQVFNRMGLSREITGNTVYLLYAGRLAPEKNLDLLLGMMDHLPDEDMKQFRLLVAGSGPLAGWFRDEAAKRFPGRIVMLGQIDNRRQLACLMAGADAFIHPNPCEPFGIAPLEAMAAGTPLVAPEAGGITEYANHGNAWLAPPEPAAFAGEVKKILQQRFYRQIKTARGRDTAMSLSWDRVANRFFTHYDQLCHSNRRASRGTTRIPTGNRLVMAK